MPALFGTNGVRGVVNRRITPELSLRLGKAIGRVLGGSVAVATDARGSADMVRSAVVSGLLWSGADVVDLGMLPTPALQYYVKTHDGVSGGVMVTASHNPPEFNGIKCISSDGTEASRMMESSIEEAFGRESRPERSMGRLVREPGAAEAYIDAVISKVDAAAIRSAGLTVCLDCANGAACATSPSVLARLGVRAVTLNSDPQGNAPGREIEPTESSLSDLEELVRKTGAALGIAHDGDGDRCVFVTSEGRFVPGDQSMAVIASYVLSRGPGKVVAPVNTSSVVEDAVVAAGGELVYTLVGAPAVARKAMDCGAVLAGEENGGIIFPGLQFCRDGAMALAMMLECIVSRGPLDMQLAELPEYCSVKTKVGCPDELKHALSEEMRSATSGFRTDFTDGIKVFYPDGWVLLRPSGTEPYFRIFSEAKDESSASSRAEMYARMAEAFVASRTGIRT